MEHYMYSSARNYINNAGFLAVTFVDNPVIEVLKKINDQEIESRIEMRESNK